jgi:putative transposase
LAAKSLQTAEIIEWAGNSDLSQKRQSALIDTLSKCPKEIKVVMDMDASFCIEALEDALQKYGKPEIFNTDQGVQFTSSNWIQMLTNNDIKVSMDGKGRWVDNVFIERLWRSL